MMISLMLAVCCIISADAAAFITPSRESSSLFAYNAISFRAAQLSSAMLYATADVEAEDAILSAPSLPFFHIQ